MTPSPHLAAAVLIAALGGLATASEATSVTQHGITWTFDQPRQVGQFITGDWWVVGPVTVIAITPEPGPAAPEAGGKTVKSRYGATGMVDDSRMRHGSMIVERSLGQQGYDSRPKNYDPTLSLALPITLATGQSLISTESNATNPHPALLKDIMWRSEANVTAALKSAAVLTCLAEVPPVDAFRPPYAGTDKLILRESQIRWSTLPELAPAGTVPDWAMVERWFERPWLDHISSWVFQLTGPHENQANYGREFSRSIAIASLMLMLDVPQEQKRTLMIRVLQRGIDIYGLVQSGRRWSGDGGHWNGRKLPLLFAGILLDEPRLMTALDDGLFSEDQQTYYGTGFHGDTALYQIVNHTGPKPPHEEKDPKQWNDHDKRSESYRRVCSVGWPGMALAALMLEGKAAWNHDAFFDYCDRWMNDPDARGLPDNAKVDAFVQSMWEAHRDAVPAQAGGAVQRQWHWEQKVFVPAEKPKP